MAAKVAYDTAVADRLAREEWRDNGALCDDCQAATVASAASLLLVLPEAAQAARAIAGFSPEPSPADGAA